MTDMPMKVRKNLDVMNGFWKPETKEIIQELYDFLMESLCKDSAESFINQIVGAIKSEYGD